MKNAAAETGALAQNPPHFASLPMLMKPNQTGVSSGDAPPAPSATQPPAAPASTEAKPADTTAMPAQEVAPVVAVPPEAPVENAEEAQSHDADNPGASQDEDDNGEPEDEAPKVIEKQGPNGKITYVERQEDSKLILELVLDDKVTVLSSELPAWQVNETVLIPLGKFAELVHFPIKVDAGAGTADGWFLDPKNTFHLAFPYNAAEISGKPITVKGGIAETHVDDIYVSLELINAWFPVQTTLNYNELRLYMKTLKDLPFEAEAKRKAAWEALQASRARTPGLDYDPKDVIKLPYRMYAAPTIQLTHSLNLLSVPSGDTTTTANSFTAQTDLLGMSARLTGAMQTTTSHVDELTGITMNLQKEDYDAGLLGPMHATRYEMGDITTGPFPLAGQQSGRGGVVTNQPYNFVSDANNFHIQGFGPAGWDVEVFQDNELLAFGETGVDGKYEFNALPLSDGFNLFKVILYGPNGEQETRYERFYLGQNMVPKGKIYYNAALLQSSTPVLDVSSAPPGETPGTISLSGEYGVTNWMSAMGGYFRGPIANTTLDGLGMGLRTSGGSAYAQINAFFDKSGGQSTGALVTGNLSDTTSFNITHTYHRAYDPGVYAIPLHTGAQVSKLFSFSNKIIPGINATLGVARERNDAGQVKFAYTNRLSTAFLGLALTNELEMDAFADNTARTYSGIFTGRYRGPFGNLQASLTYIPYPWELSAGSITLQKDLTEKLTANAGIGHTFGATPKTNFTGSLDYKMEKVRLGIAGSIDTDNTKQIGVTATYALVPQSLKGNYMVSGGTDDLNTGRLLVRPFEDRNSDGIWEAGEPLVKDVAFRNLLRGNTSVPGADGLVSIPGLTPSLANRITVDDKSLTDLTISPAKKQLVVLGKRGVNGPLDYPFTKTGNIIGKLLYSPNEGEESVMQNIHMILLDSKGKQVADTYSEYDGYFGFEDIPLGTYEIFFPAAPELSAYYTGNGEGPKFTITFEHPEMNDIILKVDGGQIIVRNPEAAPAPVSDENKSGENNPPKLDPMLDTIKTNPINDMELKSAD